MIASTQELPGKAGRTGRGTAAMGGGRLPGARGGATSARCGVPAALTVAMGARGGLPTPLAAARAWFVEPVEEGAVASELGAGAGRRPVIAVFGLADRCGATVVARALAAGLAARDGSGVAVVSGGGTAASVAMASRPAARLAGVLSEVTGASTRAVGRLCLVAGADAVALADSACHHAPLVLDAGAAAVGGVSASIADRVVLVATPRLEPALARVVATGLARIGPEPLVVLNQASSADARWERAAHMLPESRVAARVAVAGHEPRGAFGRSLRGLVESSGGLS